MLTLRNGMRLIVAARDWNRVLALNLFIEGGSAEDPQGLEGLANLAQNLLLKGTSLRSAEQIAREIESVGGQIDVSTSVDFAEAYTVTVVEDLPLALDLLADVVLRPTFLPEEIEKERALALSQIRRRQDDPFAFTYEEFLKALYEGHPYGHPVEGEEPSVKAIAAQDIGAFHARRCHPQRMVLAACGNVEPKALAQAVELAFAEFPAGQPSSRLQAYKRVRPKFESIELRKDCKQAFIIAGFPAVPYSHEDYPALRVANAILGEGMSARLFRRLRDERSLAYDVGSALVPRLYSGHLILWIGASPQMAETARLGLLAEARSLAQGLTNEEFDRAKQYLIGRHLIARQSNQAKAHYLGLCEVSGVGFGFDDRLPDLLRRVSKEQALSAFDRYVRASPISVALLPKGAVASSRLQGF